MSKHGWRLSVYGILAALVAGLFFSAGGTAHAAARTSAGTGDPFVVVARFAPVASCIMQISKVQGNQMTTSKTMQCPAGSVIGTVHIHLSEALASGESYVVLPSHDASSAIQMIVKQQIFALLQAKGPHSSQERLQSSKISPNLCSGSYNVHATWYPAFDHATTYYSEMDYQNCGNGSLWLTSSKIQLLGGLGYYWDHDQYASGSWGRGCQGISTNGNTGGLNTTEPTNKLYYAYVSQGWGCAPWDNYSYYWAGPAN